MYYVSTLKFIATLYDNATDPTFPEGVSCLFSKLDSCDDDIATMIRNSIVVNYEWAEVKNTAGVGTVQDFTKLSVRIPDGWNTSEDASGNVYITSKDKNATIGLQVLRKGNTSVQNLAIQAFNVFNGTGNIRDGRFGLYFYTASGNIIFVFDNTIQFGSQTHPGMPDGVVCVMHLEGGLFFDETDMVFASIVVNDKWAKSNNVFDAADVMEGTVQTFTRISVKVPKGWTASQNSTGTTVYIASGDIDFSIQVGTKSANGGTLETTANTAYNNYHGIGELEYMQSGLYMFSTTYSTIFAFDNSFASQLRDDYICLISLRAKVIPLEVINTIFGTVKINEDWIDNTPIDYDPEAGTVQEFTRMFIKIPDGWEASENKEGDVVYITHENPVSSITVQLIEKNGRTLKEIAEEYYTALVGEGEMREIVRNKDGVYDGSGYGFSTESNGAANLFDGTHFKGPAEEFAVLLIHKGRNVGYNIQQIFESLTVKESSQDDQTDDNVDDKTDEVIDEEEAKKNLETSLGEKPAYVEEFISSIPATTAVKDAVTAEGYSITNDAIRAIKVTTPGLNAFELTVPTALRGLDAANVKVYIVHKATVEAGEFKGAVLPDGITEATLLGSDGKTYTKVPTKVWASAELNNTGEYGVYVANKGTSTKDSDAETDNNNKDGSVNSGSGGGGCNAGILSLASVLVCFIFLQKGTIFMKKCFLVVLCMCVIVSSAWGVDIEFEKQYKLSIEIPGDYLVSRNRNQVTFRRLSGKTVSGTDVFLTQVITKKGRTLEEITGLVFDNDNGSDKTKLQNGLYNYKTGSSNVFVFDKEYNPQIHTDYCCLFAVGNGATFSDQQITEIRDSIAIIPLNDDGEGNDPDNTNDGTGNNDDTKNSGSLGGGGGGCNSGMSALALMLSGLVFFGKKQ